MKEMSRVEQFERIRRDARDEGLSIRALSDKRAWFSVPGIRWTSLSCHVEEMHWARIGHGMGPSVFPGNAFPLVGRHLEMVGLTGLELVNRLRGQRRTGGD